MADLREEICRVGRELYRAGLIAGRAGNISARVDPDTILVTPRGTHKARLERTDPVLLSLRAPAREDLARATTEIRVHLESYQARRDIGAVIHTHAPALTAAGLRDLRLAATLPELEAAVGQIATVEFHPSGSQELGRAVGRAIRSGAAVALLQGHGAVAVGTTLDEAQDRTELAELAARAVVWAS